MLKLTPEVMRQLFPNAPQSVLDAFVAKQDILTKAGINHTRTRLAYFFANIEHECGGFTIRNLTENINYTAERMAAVWPNRFSSPGAVRAKYGSAPGWQKRAFDDIYGNRMGNRPGSSDGSRYIGRGGPQVTGRDGFQQVGRRAGLDLVTSPELASRLDMQPEICAAFWTWKNLNANADANDFLGCVKLWNGGTNGLADRKHLMAGNDPIIRRLAVVDDLKPILLDAPKAKPAPPSVTNPSKGSIGAFIASIFNAAFRRK
jgi:putative chitinase